ncbi:MAG TPA: hypothetical protein VNZ64_03535 [Candidatus Acidoferrum sp.]|jgi:hypothetical protein|nr:hypothetical protein [Candidatus Acidoferrum sp.]
MQPPITLTSPRIEFKPPRLLTNGAVLTVCLYGVLLMMPVLISVLVVSVLQLGILTWLIPLATLAAATCFLPFGFGNPHVARLARSLRPASGNPPDSFIVQVTLAPRLRSGMRALIEDADDIGWLSFSESELVFQGDSVNLSIPFTQSRLVRPRSIGVRGLYLYPSITLAVSGLPNIDSLTFAERSTWLLPAARATTRQIRRRLEEKIPAHG